MDRLKRIPALLVVLVLLISGCTPATPENGGEDRMPVEEEKSTDETGDEADSGEEEAGEETGETYILFTSDVHCGIDTGFGYAGLKQVKDELEAKGHQVILVDDGDAIQGDAVGTLSRGGDIISLMNDLEYDVAIPGNHEFDYGVDRFLELTKQADFPYISCNFHKDGELVFKPSLIIEANGKKIGFVGVTSPDTLKSTDPKLLEDENGRRIYGFMEDETGQKLYDTVQKAVDDVRAEGAELVYAIAHLGNEKSCEPWTYADVIANTSGIDVMLDGHSHDIDQIVMKNKDGEQVIRSAVGTKMACIGFSHIDAEGKIVETDILSWTGSIAAPDAFGIRNELTESVDEIKAKIAAETEKVVGRSEVDLKIYDPEETEPSGKPVRIIRRMETNLGDFCADAIRETTGADIVLMNGGGIRDEIGKGEITYGEIISVYPFNNLVSEIEVTGQQILDALEWGASAVPEENGGFLQVSGLSYTIDVSIDSSVEKDEDGKYAGIGDDRRVKDVYVGDERLDPGKTYTLAGNDYILLKGGDGYTMFEGANVILQGAVLDNIILIDYLTKTLGGVIGEGYENPYGQGRIVIEE